AGTGWLSYCSLCSNTAFISGDTAITFDENEPLIDVTSSGKTSTSFYPVILKDGSTYTLVVQVDLLVVQQTAEVLWSIFPYVILMIFALSFLCSLIYARYITRPIVRLSKISEEMASLDFSGQCSMAREDELGCLAQNLNSLSTSLSTALNDLHTANDQLKADIEKEQELERQRVDFFSAASHELKTPLTILKGHLAGMLNKISGYENHTEYMERSLAVVERMEKLVKELLYVSKTDGPQKSEYKTVDFAEIVRVQIAAVTDLLEEKKQRLEVNIPDRLSCEVERAQMERAIQNILVNAIRYSPDGELIRVSLAEADTTVCCEVENTGVHIPEDALSHLFEAFYRTDTSRNRNTGGTGLGLYIVRKIMELHKAEYGIRNSSRGVLFWLKIPTKRSDDIFFLRNGKTTRSKNALFFSIQPYSSHFHSHLKS
ncbi:MAG: ATP-binding protein, partial [Blautia massiliensis (ex Durand et al. 2017)]